MVGHVARIVVLAIAALFLLTQPALGAAGDLDTSFSADGVVLTDFPGKGDEAAAIAVQTDGAIVAVGRTGTLDPRFAVARYLEDGSRDRSFGGGDGRVVTNLTIRPDFATGLAIQPDGAIVVVGRAGGFHGRFAAVRYLPDGELDPSFGGDGIVRTNFTRRDDYASAVVIQSDGAIVLVGRARERSPASSSAQDAAFALVRYLPDGSLDASFSGDGKIFTNLSAGEDYAFDVAIGSDDRIVVAGRAGGSRGRFALARYEPDGGPDVTFGGGDGTVFTNLSTGDDHARSVALQADGGIVAAGPADFQYGSRFAVNRYDSSGALDPTFSGDGKATTRFAEYFVGWWFDVATGVELQEDGKIVVAGTSIRSVLLGQCCDEFAAVARFAPDGSLDPTFSGDGKVVEDIGPSHSAAGLALQADGSIVIAGRAFIDPSFATYFVIERYLSA